METQEIWRPVAFDECWLQLNTEQIDQVLPAWFEKRAAMKDDNDELKEFFERIKRRQAIETGIVEGLYTLSRGATETFVMQGFAEDYLQHGDTNVSNEQLLGHLTDQYEALDWVFDFIKSDRTLSVGFIKELHALLTRHQETATGVSIDGKKIPIPLLHGDFKKWPNNPRNKEGAVVIYCPPEQVDSEMDAFISLYADEMQNAHILIRAAWTHFTFVQIHPFQDGNGRMARLLTSLVLIQGGLFPFALERTQRPQYIDALEAADAGNYQPLLDMLIADQLDSMGPEIIAKALLGEGESNLPLQERRGEIYQYVKEIIDRNVVAIRPYMQVHQTNEYYKSLVYFNFMKDAKTRYTMMFDVIGERSNIHLRCYPDSPNTQPVVVTLDMGEASWQLLIEDYVQKNLTYALRNIMPLLRGI